MKEQSRKMPRGQMIYAPISSTENRSRSPFSEAKRTVSEAKRSASNLGPRQEEADRQQMRRQESKSRGQQSPQSPYQGYEPSIRMAQSASPFHEYEERVQSLMKQNNELKGREEIYVSKLLKLQEGLENQHQEFMNLQQLYDDLFNIYKLKQQEIAQLELRYKETERSRLEFSSQPKKDQNLSLLSIDKINSVHQLLMEDSLKNELTQLIFQNKRLNQTNEKLVSELNYLKSKEKLNDSRHDLSQKVLQELSDCQKQADWEKEQKIKLDYENKFLKMRNEDLEKTISELEKVISIKQTEILKMREEKFATRRHSSEKALNKSPPKPTIDTARSKTTSQENKKFIKLIQNLQNQNQRLRDQNLLLKEKLKGNIFQKDPSKLHDSFYSKGSQIYSNLQKRLDFLDSQNRENSNGVRNNQNENFNSQNLNEQYFSFSQEREERKCEEELPSFPMDLQIEGIIRKHEELNKQFQGESKNYSSDLKESY